MERVWPALTVKEIVRFVLQGLRFGVYEEVLEKRNEKHR